MDDLSEQILSAKVAMLERLVRALYKDAFLKAKDPLAAVDSFAERHTKRFETGVAAKAWTVLALLFQCQAPQAS